MKQLIFCLCLLMAGCHERRPPAPTPEENAQLDDAEDMLNAMGQNEEGPEANATGPSNHSD